MLARLRIFSPVPKIALSKYCALAVLAIAGFGGVQAYAASAPCQEIKMVCRQAGFIEGAGRAGNGLEKDCFDPIVSGAAQPGGASIPLPRVGRDRIDACRSTRGQNAVEAEPMNERQGAGATHVPRPSSSGLGAPPNGLVAVIEYDTGQKLDPGTFSNPYVSGIAIQIHWSDIEPSEGTYDWSVLDKVVGDAAASNKWVQFLIWPGFFTPGWALKGVQTDTFPLQYGPGHGEVETLPMPWDKVYLGRWLAFIGQVSARYGNSPALKLMAADGPTSVSAEATLPNSVADLKKWQADGYTPAKYVGAWKQVFTAYAANFPKQYVSYSMGGGLDIDNAGKIAKGEVSKSRQDNLDAGMKILGSRFALQWSNLDGTTAVPSGMTYVIGYNGQIVTGFQLRSSVKAPTMGEPGDSEPVILRDAINKGMQANGSGNHINYLEIYEPDVLNSDLQPVLKYGASLFAPKSPHIPRPGCSGTHCL